MSAGLPENASGRHCVTALFPRLAPRWVEFSCCAEALLLGVLGRGMTSDVTTEVGVSVAVLWPRDITCVGAR